MAKPEEEIIFLKNFTAKLLRRVTTGRIVGSQIFWNAPLISLSPLLRKKIIFSYVRNSNIKSIVNRFAFDECKQPFHHSKLLIISLQGEFSNYHIKL